VITALSYKIISIYFHICLF